MNNSIYNDFVRITLTSAATFRLGVWIDGQNDGEYATTLTVKTADDVTIDTQATAGSPNPNSNIDWYFWDITGGPGDVFVVSAFNSASYVDLGGITIDMLSNVVPEPATISLLALGGLIGLGLIIRRRKKGTCCWSRRQSIGTKSLV